MSRMSKLSIAILTILVTVLSFPQTIAAQHDAIKVHGGWTIEIHNADGTVARRYEFQNALTVHGQRRLAGLLINAAAVRGAWAVDMFNSQSLVGACGGARGCVLGEIDTTSMLGAYHAPLTVSSAGNGELRLQGSVTATQDATIDNVRTLQVDPGGGWGDFSVKVLPSSIAVVAGQVVSISVVISFS